MDLDRRRRVTRAAEDLLTAIREIARCEADREFQRSLLGKAAPQRFLKAVEAFAVAIGD